MPENIKIKKTVAKKAPLKRKPAVRKKVPAKKKVKRIPLAASRALEARPAMPEEEKWLPDNVIEVLIGAVSKPKKTFAQELPKATLKKGVGLLGLYQAIIGFIIGLLISLFGALFLAVPEIAAKLGFLSGLILMAWLILPIFAVVAGLLSALISNGIIYLFAKLLGGQGRFEEQFYLVTLYSVPIAFISLLLSWIPAISLLIALYALYLMTIALRTAHRYSTGRAILTWLIPIAIFFIFFLAIILAVALAAIGAASY